MDDGSAYYGCALLVKLLDESFVMSPLNQGTFKAYSSSYCMTHVAKSVPEAACSGQSRNLNKTHFLIGFNTYVGTYCRVMVSLQSTKIRNRIA